MTELQDTRQNFWQLASIQITTIGIPGSIIAGQIAKKYGVKTACNSVLIGNLILWAIGLVIVRMSSAKRSNAIENIKHYLGPWGALLSSCLLTIAFLIWFPINIYDADIAIDTYFHGEHTFFKNAIIFFLCILTSLVSWGGIRLIKYTCVLALPLLLTFLCYVVFFSKQTIIPKESLEFSFKGTTSIIAVILAGTVNLPTFFRHSRSIGHSVFALSTIAIFVSLFQILSLFAGISNPIDFFSVGWISSPYYLSAISLLYILLFSLCVNLGNIYFISAPIDAYIPFLQRRLGSGKFVLIGLLATGFFFISKAYSLKFTQWENLVEGFIANLDVLLVLGFVIKKLIRHKLQFHEKLWGAFCWMTGCTYTAIIEIYTHAESNESLVAGITATSLAILGAFFVEEAIWSAKKVMSRLEE